MQTTRPTRRASTELTRRRLIDGAVDILRREGVTAATTGRIARAAGLKQPSFYVHFADRDEILQAAALEIGRRMIGTLRNELSAIDPAQPRKSIRAAYGAIVDAFLAETELTRIFLRHRVDDGTVLGRAFRKLLDKARGELVESLARHKMTVSRDAADTHVELVVAGVLGMLEGLLDGRLRDREVTIDAIARMTEAMLQSLARSQSRPQSQERREGK